MLKLYQFPISHFCEKVRWALDFKGIAHKKVNVIPGLHIKKMKKLSGRSSVPVIKDGEHIISGSIEILDYLDQQYPDKLLTPTDIELQKEAHAWELYAGENIGVPVRQICYHTLLNHPELVRQFFTQDGPWYGPIFVKMAFPKLSVKMRKLMNINHDSVEVAKVTIADALEKIQFRLAENQFLVGDHFGRADLTAAALFAPFIMPSKYGLNWPEKHPSGLSEYIDSIRRQLGWVETLYKNHR